MGVREGGSYAAGKDGSEKLVERTAQPEPPAPVEAPAAPEVMSAPAAATIEAGDDGDAGRRRPATKPQE